MNSAKMYQIALTLLPKVGDVLAKKLIAYCGGVEAVFKESKKSLLLIPGIGTVVANSILSQKVLSSAELEIRFMSKHTIDPVFFLDENYSFRLKQCADAPIMLYTRAMLI